MGGVGRQRQVDIVWHKIRKGRWIRTDAGLGFYFRKNVTEWFCSAVPGARMPATIKPGRRAVNSSRARKA